MDREKAIRIAQALITDFKFESDTMVDFCNTVIEVLKQEPCEDCEDSVSRQAVMDTISNANCGFDRNFELDYGMCYKAELEDAIEKLPSVQPTTNPGKWIDNDDGTTCFCSECQETVWKANVSKFCPNCGAKMEVEK